MLKHLNSEQETQIKRFKFEDIFEHLEKQKEVVQVMTRLLEIREDLLEEESLPVGQTTGPDSTVTL